MVHQTQAEITKYGKASDQYQQKLQKLTNTTHKQNSGTERFILLTPIFFVSRMLDYEENNMLLKVRVTYAVVQLAVAALVLYIRMRVKQTRDLRPIYTPDLSFLSMQNLQKPKLFRSTYMEKEIATCNQHLRAYLFATLLTAAIHYFLGWVFVLLLQIFMTPYNALDSRLFKKWVVGIEPGVRVWNELYRTELAANMVITSEAEERAKKLLSDEEEAKAQQEGSAAAAAAPEEEEEEGAPWEEEDETAWVPLAPAQEAALRAAFDENSAALFAAAVARLGPEEVDRRTGEGWTPLMLGCGIEGAGPAVARLLDWGAGALCRDRDGWGALHWACQHGQLAAAAALAALPHEKNAMLALRAKDGRTPRELAAAAEGAGGNAELLALLEPLVPPEEEGEGKGDGPRQEEGGEGEKLGK